MPPAKLKVEPGIRFGMLTVVAKASPANHGHPRWLCACECGKECVVRQSQLTNRVSCGCEARAKQIVRNTKHGMFGTVEYHCWNSMRGRCQNPQDANYKNYGGRGISVCEQWQSFEGFFADMGYRPSKEHSLDRIDNDGNYTPENCRWATRNEQGRNRRTCTFIDFDGHRKAAIDWCELLGVPYQTVMQRLSRGISFVDAVTHGYGELIRRTREKICLSCGTTMFRGHTAKYCITCYAERNRQSKRLFRQRKNDTKRERCTRR